MDWKIGDKVTIHSHYGGEKSVRTLTAVGKTKMTDNKGEHWHVQGRKWGTSNERWYTGDRLYEYTEGDEAKIYRKRLLAHLAKYADWEKLPTEKLEEVYKVIKPTVSDELR